jgi:hypothetical protein
MQFKLPQIQRLHFNPNPPVTAMNGYYVELYDDTFI